MDNKFCYDVDTSLTICCIEFTFKHNTAYLCILSGNVRRKMSVCPADL